MNSVNGSGYRAAYRRDAENPETVVINGLTEKIIGAAIVVHKTLGPGFWNRLIKNVRRTSFPLPTFSSNVSWHCR